MTNTTYWIANAVFIVVITRFLKKGEIFYELSQHEDVFARVIVSIICGVIGSCISMVLVGITFTFGISEMWGIKPLISW